MDPQFYQRNVVESIPVILDRLDSLASGEQRPLPAAPALVRADRADEIDADEGADAGGVDQPPLTPFTERVTVVNDDTPLPAEDEREHAQSAVASEHRNPESPATSSPCVVEEVERADRNPTGEFRFPRWLRGPSAGVDSQLLEPARAAPLVSVTIHAPQPPPVAAEVPRGPGPLVRGWRWLMTVATTVTGDRRDIGYGVKLVGVVGAAALFLSQALVAVPQGTIGVRSGVDFGGGRLLTPGPYVVIPGLSQLELYSAGEIERSVTMTGLLSADRVPVEHATVRVTYRVEPDAYGQVISLENAPEVDAQGVRQPLAQKVSRDVGRLVNMMVSMVEADRLVDMRRKIGLLLHEDLQKSLDAWVPGGVRIVGVDVAEMKVTNVDGTKLAAVETPHSLGPDKVGLPRADAGFER